MKYESDILKRLINTYGVVGNPRYISEIIKEFIVRGKERFPELFTYQADWLAHIDEFGLNPTYTVTYTGQSIYAPNTLERPVKSAILKGSTKYRDIDTGEVLDAFEDGRNLELVSVRMPVLTTIGKNLISDEVFKNAVGNICEILSSGSFRLKNSTPYIVNKTLNLGLNTSKKIAVSYKTTANNTSFALSQDNNGHINLYIQGYLDFTISELQIEYSETPSSYEPYKSNILTVNEDVTLRSNGDICDELNLLTGQLTQRIDENGEVLSQEIVKTVDLNVEDQNGNTLTKIKPIEGTMHLLTDGNPIKPTFTGEIPVESITQNLASFIEE